MISQTTARIYFPGGSPIGKTFSVGNDPEWQNIDVIGIAKDAKYRGLTARDPLPAEYYPHAQHRMFLNNLVVRRTGDPAAITAGVRKRFRAIAPNLPVGDITTLQNVVDDSVVDRRLLAHLSTAFGLLAAFLSASGSMALSRTRSQSERASSESALALGAGRGQVLWLVVSEALRLILTAALAGVCSRPRQRTADREAVVWFEALRCTFYCGSAGNHGSRWTSGS